MFFDNDQNKRSKRNSQLGERIIQQMLMFINMLTRLLSVLRPGIRKFMYSESILELKNTIFCVGLDVRIPVEIQPEGALRNPTRINNHFD